MESRLECDFSLDMNWILNLYLLLTTVDIFLSPAAKGLGYLPTTTMVEVRQQMGEEATSLLPSWSDGWSFELGRLPKDSDREKPAAHTKSDHRARAISQYSQCARVLLSSQTRVGTGDKRWPMPNGGHKCRLCIYGFRPKNHDPNNPILSV